MTAATRQRGFTARTCAAKSPTADAARSSARAVRDRRRGRGFLTRGASDRRRCARATVVRARTSTAFRRPDAPTAPARTCASSGRYPSGHAAPARGRPSSTDPRRARSTRTPGGGSSMRHRTSRTRDGRAPAAGWRRRRRVDAAAAGSWTTRPAALRARAPCLARWSFGTSGGSCGVKPRAPLAARSTVQARHCIYEYGRDRVHRFFAHRVDRARADPPRRTLGVGALQAAPWWAGYP